MQDTTLLKAALITSVIGIIVLYLFSMQLEVEKLGFENKPGDTVRLVGTVQNVNEYGNVTFVDIKTNKNVKVVVFDKVNIPGEKVEIVGELQTYKGEKEVIAKSIKAVS